MFEHIKLGLCKTLWWAQKVIYSQLSRLSVARGWDRRFSWVGPHKGLRLASLFIWSIIQMPGNQASDCLTSLEYTYKVELTYISV